MMQVHPRPTGDLRQRTIVKTTASLALGVMVMAAVSTTDASAAVVLDPALTTHHQSVDATMTPVWWHGGWRGGYGWRRGWGWRGGGWGWRRRWCFYHPYRCGL